MLLPPALGSSPHPPVSVCGTGTIRTIAAFLDTRPSLFPTFLRSSHGVPLRRSFGPARASAFPGSFPGRASRVCPRSSVASQYRNLYLLSIGYGPRPRLRPRLTQSRSALLWKPWIFGLEDSHLHLATHSGILSSRTSTRPFGHASLMRQCSPTDACASQSFGGMFEPRVFSARSLSTSELLRTL